MFQPQKITRHYPNQKNANQKNKRRKKTAMIRSATATIKIDQKKIAPRSFKASRARLVNLIPPPFEPADPMERWDQLAEQFSTRIRELAWEIKGQKPAIQIKKINLLIRQTINQFSRLPHNGKTNTQILADLFKQSQLPIDPQKNFTDVLPALLKLVADK